MNASRLIPDIKNLKYEWRLQRLKLPALKYRRTGGDMIQLSGQYIEYFQK